MKHTLSLLLFLWFANVVNGQGIGTKWYSETRSNGVRIQNSFPKGGPYTGPTEKYFNYSYLVFYTRVANETGKRLELTVDFSADSIQIPKSPDTFVKLLLPSDTMTLKKQTLFSYGITTLESFEKPTRFRKTLNPNEDCYFYVVALFYQTKPDVQDQGKGGNRAELVLEGQELYYRMSPQVDRLYCGRIIVDK